MAEAIISRSGGGEAEQIIPITPGYHSLLVTLKSKSSNAPLANASISCKDGERYYNYTTNEKGQCLFMCNSGAANISITDTIEGIKYFDIDNTRVNVDAPIGQSSKINIYHNDKLGVQQFNNNTNIIFLNPHVVDINIVGGGGGGSGSYLFTDNRIGDGGKAAGGGGGYINNYPDQELKARVYYNFKAGNGGSGGFVGYQRLGDEYNRYGTPYIGGTGGTSIIENTSYMAVGGAGGEFLPPKAGVGGTGNGSIEGSSAQYSPVDFAGGGGSGVGGDYGWNGQWTKVWYVGSPGGGNGTVMRQLWDGGYWWQYSAPESGKIGGGGGGARPGSGYTSQTSFRSGGRGGDGVLRINIKK